MLAAKLAVVFFNIFFILVYAFILRKYVRPFFAACILIVLTSSYFFSIYFLYLRSITLANIFMIAGIYFLINKKWLVIFILSLLYPLAHISFFTMIIFVFACETIRYLCEKEFFFRNVNAVILGLALGCFIHPNYPNNLLGFYLNGFLVPWYTLNNAGVEFGRELLSSSARYIVLANFSVFFSANIIFWLLLSAKIKVSFPTMVWWACTSIFLVFGFWSNRYWYQVNILFFIFFASFIKDWGLEKYRQRFSRRISILTVAYIGIIFLVSYPALKHRAMSVKDKIFKDIDYENAGRWMNKNIPAGETVYHAFWSDSPYFICLNPKNNYLVILDPIYMYYLSPWLYNLYSDLYKGRIISPVGVLNTVFMVNYGFTNKIAPLYRQIKSDSVNFKILYENRTGVVFKVLSK